MKRSKLLCAALAALTAVGCFTACGDSSSSDTSGDTTTTEEITTTSETVAINTAVLSDEDKEKLDNAGGDLMIEQELENKTIKWLAHYDINPNTSGNSKSVQLELFESKYGGNVKWYETTWNTRYTDLSTYVLGGEGIDFFPCDTEALPRGITNGMFQPVDSYIDMSSELWSPNEAGMELFNFNGSHYAFVVGLSPESVVYYNKQTISENGLDDPWELYEKGEWNWNTFKQMLADFVDPDSEQYGLDGWYYENALRLSGGMPSVSIKDGVMQLNLYEPALERTMAFAEDLYKNGLTLDLSMFDWKEQPHFMGEGKELFYLAGAWHTYSDPSIWATKVPPENMGIVPVPCDPDGEPAYAVSTEAYVLCKGAANPEGVARYAECGIIASRDEEAVRIGRQKCIDDYGWTDEMLDHYDECVRLAKEYPVYELGTGVSPDFNAVVTSYATYEPFRGGSFPTLRDETMVAAQALLDEVNGQLASAG